MASVNKVFLIGYLGQDPECKTLGNGNLMVTLSLATSKRWKDKDGNQKEKTAWHRIVVYHKQSAEFAQKYLKKASFVYVEGELDQREYEKDGEKRHITEVLLQGFSCQLMSLKPIEGGSGSKPPVDESAVEDMPY